MPRPTKQNPERGDARTRLLEAARDVIRAQGFADSVREAASRIGGHVLFDLPCPSGEGCQRVAAIVAAQDHEMQVLLVILAADGLSVSTENASDSDHAFAGFALSHAALSGHLAGLGLGAAE